MRGFGISLAPADGNKRPAYGAALGRLSGDILRLVLVIGEEEAVVEETRTARRRGTSWFLNDACCIRAAFALMAIRTGSDQLPRNLLP